MSTPAAKQTKNAPTLRQAGIDAAAKTVATFSIRMVQYLDENANIVNNLPTFAEDNAELLKLVRTMLLLHQELEAHSLYTCTQGHMVTFVTGPGIL